tara:strand:- start:12786 stop:13568 length:783 start_codon:yes stop_codon:yes gene_type:complete
MEQKLVLILLTYYNRPKLVRNALNSILKSNVYHQNWKLIFGDDASPIPGEPIAREILDDHIDQIEFIRKETSLEEKLMGGISLGKYANEILRNTDAEIIVPLNDDDELHPEYLGKLNYYFTACPEVLYCYSNIHLYNPLYQKSEDVDNIVGPYNEHTGPINLYGRCDASQVAWRISCNKEKDAWLAENTADANRQMPWATNTDAEFFNRLYEKCGPACYSGFVSQYKGIHDYQLLWHKKAKADELREYIKEVDGLAGDKF